MKKLISILTIAFAAACPLLCPGQNSFEKDPAYLPIDKAIDLKVIKPEVNVNLPRFLLLDVTSDLGKDTNGPLAGAGAELADLVKDVKLIRVVVIEAKEANREALDKGVKSLRADLDAKWTTVVSVPEENVGVYAMGDPSGESMAGLAVLIHDGNDAVIANIIGRVSVGKLIKLASRLDKMPKDLLQKLQGFGETGGKSATKPADSEEKKPASK